MTSSVGGEEGYGLVETALSLAAASRQLPPQDRQVLALRFQADLKQREIAERIGVSQMQVSRILRRATDQLADQLNATPAPSNSTPRSHSGAATTATGSRYPRPPAQTR